MRNRTSLLRRVLLAVIIVAVVFNTDKLGYWIFIGILSLGIVQLILSIVKSFRRLRPQGSQFTREYSIKMVARFMALFFMTGTMIYMFTFPIIAKNEPSNFNNAELIVRSMICSLDTFTLDVDSNILDRLDDFPLIKGLIASQAALSFLCTVGLLISLIFSRAKAYYKLNRQAKIDETKCHLYLFFGMNEPSKLLAADIAKNDSKSIVVMIEPANINDDDTNSWESIVNLFTHRQRTFDLADESKALVAISSRDIADITPDDTEEILSQIGLERIKRFIEQLSEISGDKSQLHIFFMSENEDSNIRGLSNIAKDSTISQIAGNDTVKTKFYCHARNNGPNKVVEDLAVRRRLTVSILDSSHLAIELIKANVEHHPVKVVHRSKTNPTTVVAPIEALIVGFGEVGRDAFRFIYEFGVFVGENSTDTFCEPLPPRITAIDRHMDTLEGSFVEQVPNINFTDGTVKLLKMDFNELAFYENVLSAERCQKLNYIVIALGDDDQNTTLAVRVFNHIRRYRKSMADIKILTRCCSDEKFDLMTKVANHYNHGQEDAKNVISLFGNPSAIYSYNIIVNDSLTRKGMIFHEKYCQLKKEGDPWNIRRLKLTGAYEAVEGEPIIPNIDKLRKLRRQESQDLANAHHAATKIDLLRGVYSFPINHASAGILARIFNWRGESNISGSKSDIHYPELDTMENRTMRNLAMLEHLRWNAAHELLGYRPNLDEGRCDERTMRHNCLIPWESLDAAGEAADWPSDYKSYDYCVVDTSLKIWLDENDYINDDDDD